MNLSRIQYFMMNYEGWGWIRYRSGNLFAFSTPTDMQRFEIPFGDSRWNWITESPALTAAIWDKKHPSGVAATYSICMLYSREHALLDSLLSEWGSKVKPGAFESRSIDGHHGPIPTGMVRVDEFALKIRHYFSYGGTWTLAHHIAGEPPHSDWIEIADRIAASIEFISPPEEIQQQIYFKDATA